MKIMQVIPYFVPAWSYGGPISAAYNVSKELVKRGHEVTVYTTDALDTKNRIRLGEEIIDGIKVRRFRNLIGGLVHHHNIFFSPGMLFGIKKEPDDFDVIHMHEYRAIQNVIVHHHAKKFSIPYVVQAHGSLPRIMTKQNLKKLYDNLWGYKLLKDASKVIALHETEVGQYKSMGVVEDKIEIVPNGIDLSQFDNLPQRGEFRKKYGLNDDEKIILYLGRIHETKGIDLLVKAFAGLTKETYDTRLVIVGPDAGYLPELKRLIKALNIQRKTLLTGPFYGMEKLEAYVDADVCVLPSIYETFPVVVLEAWACDTPVIVTDRCGIADVINNQAGLVAPWDKEHLSNAILQMLSDDKLRGRLIRRGKSLVREKLNWQRIVEQVERVYLNCISSRC